MIYTTNGGVNWYPHPSFDTLTSKNIRSFIQSDSTDFYIAGDSLMLSLSSEVSLKPLTGETYIGPTYEFTSMSEAVDAASYLGVKDSVTFIIEPGIYEKPFEINKIFPETAVIRFKALAPNTVTITKNLSDTTNYILKLNNAGNIKFENLIFSNPDTLKGRIVLLDGKLSDLEFRNVIFNGPALTVPSGNCNIIMNNLSSNSINNLSLNNCEFNNGAYGIRLLTSASFYSTGINIDNCSFSKNLYAAVNLNYSQDFTLNGNNFDSTVQCVVLNNCRNFEVTRNKMSAVYSGLSFSACNVTGQNRNLIANNFIQSIVIGLLFASTNNGNDMYHNSICIQHPYDTTIVSASVGLFSSFFSGSDNNFVNNLIINKRRGSALNFNYSGAFPFVSFDHNDYYTTGDTLAVWKSIVFQDLNSLKAASGHDTNSVSENVYFNSAKDLHLTGSSNGNPLLAGIPVSSVPEDIDGFSRSQNLPYKGADEATIPLDFKKLFLKINFEALGITDTVNVQIRNALSPYNLIESKSGICGNGFTGQINYINAENGSPYFVAVKHRNSIETWSGIPQIFNGDTLNYDFTTGISQSYGDNMVNVSGQWSFYTGDVDQNGAVDLTDVIQIYNDAVNFLSGYIVTDLNGDNNADLTDVLSGYNNSAAFVAAVLP